MAIDRLDSERGAGYHAALWHNPRAMADDSEHSIDWIFGYGSLIWRPSFRFSERRPAILEGWSRRFWQGSTDHRGVPGAPGRVVTLIGEAGARCWGMAYRIAPEERERVLAMLDHREQGGYDRRIVELQLDSKDGPSSPRGVTALLYLATRANANFLGPASLDEMAHQVRGARGPSGDNREYVLRLAESLREHGAVDDHVFDLAARLD